MPEQHICPQQALIIVPEPGKMQFMIKQARPRHEFVGFIDSYPGH
jgi:hypothetical protein